MSNGLGKRSRKKDRPLLDKVKGGNCLACGGPADDPDHIKTRGAGGDDSYQNTVPLCREHHAERHSRGVRYMWTSYPLFRAGLLQRGWQIEEIFGRWKLVREE